MNPTPVRIQLSRKKGFGLQAASRAINGLPAVNCARPSKWGNPFVVQFDPHRDYSPQTAEDACKRYDAWISRNQFTTHTTTKEGTPPTIREIKEQLRGKNLACWCKPGAPCHCDLLLQIANA